jgi:hypothetical protein
VTDQTAAPDTAQAPSLPLFYQQPRPLDRVRHAATRLREPADLGFAASANNVPVLIEEFAHAASVYPIVFTMGAVPTPVALLGLRDRQNLFLRQREGAWTWNPDAYIPAYIRRYPLILMETQAAGEFTVCIDEAAESTVGESLFTSDGELTEAGRNAIGFCQAYQNQIAATVEFTAALQAHGLLEQNNAEIKLASGETLNLVGFLVVNPKKFDELPDDVYLDFRRKGWIGLIHLHIASVLNWERLVALTSRQ